MKAISLWQPWASAMAVLTKRNETRGWSTKYRGPLAIHAARRPLTRADREHASVERAFGRYPARIPFGAVVCVGRLVDVLRTEEAILTASLVERSWGDYAPGRFAWIFEDVRALTEPIPFIGRQGFFNVPDEMFPDELVHAIGKKS